MSARGPTGKVRLLAKTQAVRLLFLSPFPHRPLYGGAVVRNHHLGQALTRRHQVWVSFRGMDGGEEWAGEVPLAASGRRALLDPVYLWRAWRAIRDNDLQAIVASSLIAGLHGALLKSLTGRPFWMDEHNVEWHCLRRYGFKGWPLSFLLEGFVLRRADHITCVSEGDRERLIANFRLSPERVTVAPNGVDMPALHQERATERPSETQRRRVLFFGVLDYPPNREAVEILGQQIAPRAPEDIEFLVAGMGGEDLRERFPALTHLGFVDDIHALVRSCDGVIVPLKAGGGTRMKILEAVACGRPVVSTERGAEGLDREALGEALVVTDQIESMLAWLTDLPFGATAQVGPTFAETYDWQAIWARSMPL